MPATPSDQRGAPMDDGGDPAAQFCQACIDGDMGRVAEMLQHDPKLTDCRGQVDPRHRELMKREGADAGWTPLHLAAHYGNVGVVELLISAGADIDALSDNEIGNTPLMASIAGRQLGTMKGLLKGGADPTKPDRRGFTPLKLLEAERAEELQSELRGYLR